MMFNTEVRAAVAAHPATPRDTLRIPSQDANPRVRTLVARNPRTLPAIRDTLYQDTDANVRRAAMAFTPLRVVDIRSKRTPDTDYGRDR